MKTISEILPDYFSQSSYYNSRQEILPITHVSQKESENKDLVTSMKYILEQIQNIKNQVEKDRFDSFLDKTMFADEKENSSCNFSKKSIPSQLAFSKNIKSRLRRKIQTTIDLPLSYFQQEEKPFMAANQLKQCNFQYPISCSHLVFNTQTLQSESSRQITSRILQKARIQNFVSPMKADSLRIQDFQLGQCIGEGKFGDVHICRHKGTRWMFALKKILKSTVMQYRMLTQFTNQLKIQYRLDHPNIIKLYAHFCDEYHIFLLMEYAPGGNLMSKLKSTQEATSKILQQSLEAVRYMHMNHVIHRDIKPQNIVSYFDDTFKLCDFGLSAYLSPMQEVRTSFCGTLDYIAPQMKDVGLYNYSIDIWGLGILTYELLIGVAPFKEEIANWKKKGSKMSNSWKWQINYPVQLSQSAKIFMKNLLKQNPNERVSITTSLTSKFIKHRKQTAAIKEFQIFFNLRSQSRI